LFFFAAGQKEMEKAAKALNLKKILNDDEDVRLE